VVKEYEKEFRKGHRPRARVSVAGQGKRTGFPAYSFSL
jgi:hypothetical protein